MKKKVAMLLTGVMAVSLMMTGCQSAKGLETENIKISVYKGVEVDKVDKPSEVTDDDVNTQIQSVLDENSTTEEVAGRAVKKGDTATIDFVGKMNGEAFDGGSSTDYPLEIGSNSFIDGFEDNPILKKMNNSDKVALNLKLKKDKQNIWFGNVTAGVGIVSENRWKEGINLGLLKKKINSGL